MLKHNQPIESHSHSQWSSCVHWHMKKVSRVLFTMLVNRIKFIARLNEFQMNDDGCKVYGARALQCLTVALKEILQVFYNYCHCNSILWPPFDL